MAEYEVRSRGAPQFPVTVHNQSTDAKKVPSTRSMECDLKDKDSRNPYCAYPANLLVAKMLFFCTSMSNVGKLQFH